MKKDIQVIVNLEEPIAQAFERLAESCSKSKSAMLRQIVVEELNARGLLPSNMTLDLLKS